MNRYFKRSEKSAYHSNLLGCKLYTKTGGANYYYKGKSIKHLLPDYTSIIEAGCSQGNLTEITKAEAALLFGEV
jgi:hypothetical protein